MSGLGAIKKGLTASAEESPKPYAPQGEKTGPESQLPAEGRPAKRPKGRVGIWVTSNPMREKRTTAGMVGE